MTNTKDRFTKDRFTKDRFTKRARRILDIAKEQATRLNHRYIGTEHLLLGLALETQGLAAKVMQDLGIDLTELQARIESTIGQDDAQSHGTPTVAPRAKRVIDLAAYLADQLGHIYIGTEHLIMAILEEGEGIAAELLKSYVTLDEIIEQVIKNVIQSMRASPVERRFNKESIERVRQTLTSFDQEAHWSLSQTTTDVLKLRRQRMVEQLSYAAAQEERNRLARDLHDSIKQQLFSITTSAAAAEAHWQSDPEGAQQSLKDVQQNARAAMVEMDAMLQQLSPTPLVAVGLVEALRQQCEALEYRTGAKVAMVFAEISSAEAIPPRIYETLFRMAQEVFSNIARHARASAIQVRLAWIEEARLLTFEVQDDGKGFDPDAVQQGMGLSNLATRTDEVGGQLAVISLAGEGTTVRVEIPVATD